MRTSPNFTPLRPDEEQPQLLNGLLSIKPDAVQMTKTFGKMTPRRPFVDDAPQDTSLTSAAPPMPPSVGQVPPIATPPGIGVMNKTAKVQYAATTPPATAPSNVWHQGMPTVIPGPSIAQSLMDIQTNPMPVPMPPMPPDTRETPSLPPEAELIMGNDAPAQLRQPQYFNPLMYQPLQPSRRYEVL